MSRFDLQIFEYFSMFQRQMMAQPLLLGGAPGSGGGYGGRPGGFIGYLPQTRISYDMSEEATLITVTSGQSLLDNLNHIRARLQTLETTSGISGIQVKMNDILVANGVTIVNFEGEPVSITDNGGGKVTVSVSGVSGTHSIAKLYVDSHYTLNHSSDTLVTWDDHGLSNEYFHTDEPTKIFFDRSGWYTLNLKFITVLNDNTTQLKSQFYPYFVYSGDDWREYARFNIPSGLQYTVDTYNWSEQLNIVAPTYIEIDLYQDTGVGMTIYGSTSSDYPESTITIIEL